MSGSEEEAIPGFRRLGRSWSTQTYDETQLDEEVAYIAYHFHWPLAQILGLEHGDRRRWAQADQFDQPTHERRERQHGSSVSVEGAAMPDVRTTTNAAPAGGSSRQTATQLEAKKLDELTERVYRLLREELLLARERRGDIAARWR